jgi:hypothetical protein
MIPHFAKLKVQYQIVIFLNPFVARAKATLQGLLGRQEVKEL